MGERRLDSLTSVRFFACLLVVIYHCGSKFVAHQPILAALVRSGDLGVGFFFVLSGFVLAVVYAPRLKDRPLDRRKFYVARFARIYPVYLLAIVLSTIALVLHSEHLGASKLATILGLRLTLLSNWVPGYALLLNQPAWTLSVEAFFYALFPFALVAAQRMSHRARWTWLAVAIFVEMAGPYFALRLGPSDSLSSPFVTSLFFPLLHLGSFFAGVLFGLAYIDRSLDSAKGRLVLRCSMWASVAALVAVIAARPVFGATPPVGFLALPFAFLVLWLAEQDVRPTFLQWAPLVLLGEVSYGIYILQEVVFLAMVHLDRKLHQPIPTESALSFLTYLLVLGAVAIASYYLLEIPARRHLRAWLGPRGSFESRTAGSGTANEPSSKA